jgi:pimeloyl-ACP methyl ester carboxylesterase
MMSIASTNEMIVNGKQLIVYQWGDGSRPVLMMHGWGSRASRYSALAAEMTKAGYSPLAFDAPGHGESSGNTTNILEYEEISRRLADQYGPFSAIVGHSFGVLGLFKALRTGVQAEKAIAISGVSDFRYLEEEFSAQLRLGAKIRANLRQRIEKLFEHETDIWTRFSSIYEAESLDIPILVVHDIGDEVVGIHHAQQIVEAYHGKASLMQTKKLGHHRIVSNSLVISAITEFVKNTPDNYGQISTANK